MNFIESNPQCPIWLPKHVDKLRSNRVNKNVDLYRSKQNKKNYSRRKRAWASTFAACQLPISLATHVSIRVRWKFNFVFLLRQCASTRPGHFKWMKTFLVYFLTAYTKVVRNVVHFTEKDQKSSERKCIFKILPSWQFPFGVFMEYHIDSFGHDEHRNSIYRWLFSHTFICVSNYSINSPTWKKWNERGKEKVCAEKKKVSSNSITVHRRE